MNKILFNKAERLGNGNLLVPFACSDIPESYHLHLPHRDRSPEENQLAGLIYDRVTKALAKAGYQLVNLSFNNMRVTVKPTNPVK
jgi:hypothetical protein